ncbi:histone deacetylase family protein [Ignatzschineria rhizosphaerae]|uniref:Histone deacetylase family protein n=1 Tax=Ignatzschineria rhizosphaerae TaxID=2923279 RepID=A0ABY3WWK9_9GAMM|nr:histone deacetylase family protein [Ignatzschineria rhizosphaerae]UNM94989.1 histone deacetylase family protein [Ignatzschineria rhizosphaerae]
MKIYYHPHQALHNPQTYFSRGKMRDPQEVPQRVEEFQKGIKSAGFTVTTPEDLGFDYLTKVHGFAYIEFLQTAYQEWHEVPEDWGEEVIPNVFVKDYNALKGILAKASRYIADGSAPIGKHTFESIYWSAQGALNAAKAVAEGEKVSVSVSRPSGHHARREAAGGFCFVNNAALAAEYLLDHSDAKKILILDTDVHHGQGIQEIFYDRSDVMYISLHGDPTNFYPAVAGFEEERGEGEGLGFNINYPFAHGLSEEAFFKVLKRAMNDAKIFNPDVIVHNMGFDVYKDDPQSKTKVTTKGMGEIAKEVMALGKPVVGLLEGGYLIETLAANTESYIRGLAEK